MQMEFHEKAIYLYIIGLLQLASKRVLSGSDCLKIDGGWGPQPFIQPPRRGYSPLKQMYSLPFSICYKTVVTKFHHTLNPSLHYLVKRECYKLAFCVRWAIDMLRCKLPETLCMAHSNCGKRIKFTFHLFELQDRQMSRWRSSISTRHLPPLATDWAHSCVKKVFLLQHSILRCTRCHTPNFFTVVNVNSILPLSQMKIAWTSNSFEQLYLGWQFASVSCLAVIS